MSCQSTSIALQTGISDTGNRNTWPATPPSSPNRASRLRTSRAAPTQRRCTRRRKPDRTFAPAHSPSNFDPVSWRSCSIAFCGMRLGRNVALDDLHDLIFGYRSDELVSDLAALENKKGRNSTNVELPCGVAVLIDVKLHHLQLSCILARHFFNRR